MLYSTPSEVVAVPRSPVRRSRVSRSRSARASAALSSYSERRMARPSTPTINSFSEGTAAAIPRRSQRRFDGCEVEAAFGVAAPDLVLLVGRQVDEALVHELEAVRPGGVARADTGLSSWTHYFAARRSVHTCGGSTT